jgi:hypothetical protein
MHAEVNPDQCNTFAQILKPGELLFIQDCSEGDSW